MGHDYLVTEHPLLGLIGLLGLLGLLGLMTVRPPRRCSRWACLAWRSTPDRGDRRLRTQSENRAPMPGLHATLDPAWIETSGELARLLAQRTTRQRWPSRGRAALRAQPRGMPTFDWTLEPPALVCEQGIGRCYRPTQMLAPLQPVARPRLNVRILAEREQHLAVVAAALNEARSGHGRLVFVGGDAGVGKTTVVAAAIEQVPDGVRVRRGFVDNVTTPLALGSLVEAVPELADVLDAGGAVDRPLLFRRLREATTGSPTLLVLEDVHWADEATHDLLRYLGRRLDGLSLLVLATYRTEEVSARHPLATVLGDLASATGVSRLAVDPLSAAAVRELVAAADSPIDAARLHERTGGNAFYVTEVLAMPGAEVPATVRDAVLARAARLSDPARDVLAAAAVLGQPADAVLLADVAGRGPSDVDECVEQGLLVRERDGWAYRHEVARVAVEQTLAPGELTTLNARAFAALRALGVEDDRRLAHHAVMAGDRVAAGRHAVRAAARAARLSAHREAAEQYRLALRVHSGDAATREELLVALCYECYLTDEPEEALTARLKAMEIAELVGTPESLGRHQRWVSRLSWYVGRTTEGKRYAQRAIETLEPGGDGHELAMAYSNMAQLCMLAGDAEGTEKWGERALGVARRTGDGEAEIHALNNMGTARVQYDGAPEGWAMLRRSLDLALAAGAGEHAARAYTNLGTCAVIERNLAEAEAAYRAGIAYCTDRDLDAWRGYMGAQQTRVFAEQGRLAQAAAQAAEVLRHARTSRASVTTIVAMSTAAQVRLRRGEDPGDLITRAWDLAVSTGEAQRLVFVAAVLAEADWLCGRSDAVDEIEHAWTVATKASASWELAEIAYWRRVAGRPAPLATRLPEPFALMLDGDWLAAAAAWRVMGCPFWEAHALAHDPSLESGRDALAIVDRLDAPAYRTAILRTRHELGIPAPRGPRGARAGNPAALTAREFEVLDLLADGLSNAEIAARLYLSEKTVGHHVSAVLRKVGEPTRARAVAWAAREGLLPRPSKTAI